MGAQALGPGETDMAVPGHAADLLDIAPVTGFTGAVISGVELSGRLDAATVAAIRAALVNWKVIFFRGQHAMSDTDQEEFAALLGNLVEHPTAPVVPGTRALLDIRTESGDVASSWHTDVTFMPAPPDASILRAIEVPDAGGDTCWANTAAAYERLPDPLRQTVDGMRAVHSNLHDASEMYPTREGQAAYRKVFASTVYESEHPVVRVHPESGERTLLLGHFLTGFTGLSQADSRNLHAMLQGHVTKPEHVVRWRWRNGDVAIWDNRATQHRAVADFGNAVRHLRRVTVQGSVPVGVDGFEGRLLCR